MMALKPLKTEQGRAFKGQGVIEYAGALVIAAVILSVALVTLPPGAYEFFTDLQEEILTYLQGEVENLDSDG